MDGDLELNFDIGSLGPTTSSTWVFKSSPLVRLWSMLDSAEELLASPFKGVTTDGALVSGLFSGTAGAPTDQIKIATEAFLQSLDAEQRANTVFPIDSKDGRDQRAS